MTHVTFGPFHPELEERFLDTLFNLKDGDPFGRILVITPTRALSLRLMSLLAHRRPLLGVRFVTFLAFAYEIIREAGKVLPPVSNRAVIRLLLRDAGTECVDPEGKYADLFRFDSYTDALISLFSRMTSHLIEPGGDFAAHDVERIVLDIYSRYREKKRDMGVYDAEDRVHYALELLTDTDPPETASTILLYGFYDLNPLQREIVTLLSSRGDLHIFSPAIPGEPASAYAEDTSRLFTRLSAESPTILTEDTPQKPPRTSPVPLRPPGGDATVRVVSASGVAGEAEAAARRILEIKEERPDIPWRRIGVVTLETARFPNHLEAAFHRYSIPAYFDRGFALSRSPLIAACLILFGLTGDRPTRMDVTTLLSSRFFSWPGLDPAEEEWVRDHSHLADVIARNSGIIGGLEPFTGAWERASKDVPPDPPEDDEEDPHSIRIRRLSARFAQATREPIDRLIDDMSSLKPSDSPKSYADAFLSLLHTHIIRDPREEHAFDALSDIIRGMGDIAVLRESVTREDFVSLLLGNIEEKALPDRPDTDGVFTGDLLGIRGLSFDVLIVTGMNGQVFPRAKSDDPLLGEETREKMGLPTFRSLYTEDLFLFSLAVQATRKELTLFYQRSDDRGRKAIPSIVLDRIMAGDLTGAAVSQETAPRSAALDPASARYCEKDLRASTLLEAFRTGEVAPARAVIGTSRSLARGIRAMDARSLFGAFGIYDGVIGPREELKEAVRRLSPGKLETFALCPFRFFMEYVLETGAIEEPELPVDMDRAEIGNAYHRILYRLFSALKKEDLLPITNTSRTTAGERLSPIIDDELMHRMGPIPTLVKRARREIITENLADALTHEAEREHRGVVPRFFEWRFGFMPTEDSADMTPPLILETPSGAVEITGKIDRIDVDEGARVFDVIDYKTRRPSSVGLGTRIKKGLFLQLPLYLLAARDVLFSGDFTPVGASLIYLEDPVSKSREEHIDLLDSPDILDASLSHIHHFVEMMHRGIFYPAGQEPGRGCTYCDHRGHCRFESKGIAEIRKDRTEADLGLNRTPNEDGDIDD